MIYFNVNWGQKDINHVLKVWSEWCAKKNQQEKKQKPEELCAKMSAVLPSGWQDYGWLLFCSSCFSIFFQMFQNEGISENNNMPKRGRRVLSFLVPSSLLKPSTHSLLPSTLQSKQGPRTEFSWTVGSPGWAEPAWGGHSDIWTSGGGRVSREARGPSISQLNTSPQ